MSLRRPRTTPLHERLDALDSDALDEVVFQIADDTADEDPQ